MVRIADRFEHFLEVYRRPDGSRWSGQDLNNATGGVVTPSYVSTLRKGGIETPGFEKLRAIAEPMGFPPEVQFEEDVGKAGGYAIQGRAALLVEWIGGDYVSVVGLPLALTSRMLAVFGIKPYY